MKIITSNFFLYIKFELKKQKDFIDMSITFICFQKDMLCLMILHIEIGSDTMIWCEEQKKCLHEFPLEKAHVLFESYTIILS